jgi:hypothetical protein
LIFITAKNWIGLAQTRKEIVNHYTVFAITTALGLEASEDKLRR